MSERVNDSVAVVVMCRIKGVGDGGWLFEGPRARCAVSCCDAVAMAHHRRYNSMSSASFSEKSDMLDSLSELTLVSCPRRASSVANRRTYSIRTQILPLITKLKKQINYLKLSSCILPVYEDTLTPHHR